MASKEGSVAPIQLITMGAREGGIGHDLKRHPPKEEKETVPVQGKGCCWVKAPMPAVACPPRRLMDTQPHQGVRRWGGEQASVERVQRTVSG